MCYAAIFVIFSLISVYEPSRGSDSHPFVGILPCFRSFAAIFLTLKAMAKKAKSIVTLSFPKCRKRL